MYIDTSASVSWDTLCCDQSRDGECRGAGGPEDKPEQQQHRK